MTREKHAELFWAKVDRRGDEECWPWTGSKFTNNPYGRLRRGARTFKAHRVAWELTHGVIPQEMLVCHRCDNPPCCNPAHLFVGSLADNNRDRHRKGRTKLPDNRGERNGVSKITLEIAQRIRSEHATGATLADLGRRYGLCGTTVWAVVHRRTWIYSEIPA